MVYSGLRRPIPTLCLIPIVIVAPCTNFEFEYSTLRLYLCLLRYCRDMHVSYDAPSVRVWRIFSFQFYLVLKIEAEVGAGVKTSSCGCLETRVLLGSRSSIIQNYLLPIVCPLSFDFMGEVGRKHVYFGQPESFHLCMLIVDRTLLPFFRVLLWSEPCLNLEKYQISWGTQGSRGKFPGFGFFWRWSSQGLYVRIL